MGNALAVHGYENLLMLTSAKDFPKPPIEGRFIHKVGHLKVYLRRMTFTTE